MQPSGMASQVAGHRPTGAREHEHLSERVQRWRRADAFRFVTVEPDLTERAFDEFVRADGQRVRKVMSSQITGAGREV